MFGLDSMTVWGRALTDFEIAALYNSDAGLDYPFMGGPFSLIFQANLINDPANPLIVGSGFQLWSVERTFDGDTQTFNGTMDLLFSGLPTSLGYSWSADNFFNKVLFAQHDNVAQYWTPPLPSLARPLPGLPSDDAKWDGVTVFFDHVLLWQSDRLKWSDKNDFSLFIPVDTTIVSTILTISNDFVQPPVGGTVTVTVSNPVAEVISVSLSGDMTFPDTAVGASEQSILTITNTGTVPLNVSGLSLPDGFSGTFVGTVPVNGSVPVVITFTPVEAIEYIGTVTVASDATVGTSAIPVSGTGTGDTRIISLSGILDFGSLLVNRTLVSSLVITNDGNDDLTVTSVTLPSGFTGSFAGVIAAGARQIVAITFSPTAALAYGGTISVASDSTDGSETTTIHGVGVTKLTNAVFLTDNGSCQFGDEAVGGTATGTLRIYNPGSNTIKVLGLSLPGGFSGVFAGNIAAHGSHDVTVSFSPTDSINYSGIITVALSKTGPGVNTILISGTGTAVGKIIELSGSLDFGSVPINSYVQNVLTIKNVGTVAFTVSSITYPTGYIGAFSGVVNPGQSKTVLVTFTPLAAIAYNGNLTVNSDATDPTADFAVTGSGVALPTPTTLVKGQFVSLPDMQGDLEYFNFYEVVSMTGTSLVLKLLDLTGATPSGSTILHDLQIFSVDANESGENRSVGSRINGPILAVIPQGDYAIVFKERSIQSCQYVGLTSGVFFFHPEVSGEGLIGRSAVCSLEDGTIVFLGHKQLYRYGGGPKPEPVCEQLTQQLYKELDRTRLYQIRLFNNESKNEVWVQYPLLGGGFRVLIWNYNEDSASFDDYNAELLFSALGIADWTGDVSWSQFSDAATWDSLDASVTWDSLTGATKDHLTVLASTDGNLRIWGTRFAREGEGYLSFSESMIFDLGDGDVWKYVDAVRVSLQVLSPDNESRLMNIQVGCRADLNDADVTYTDPVPVLVNGHAPIPVVINPGGAGRYLSVKFSSEDADVHWRVTSFEILARAGSTY